MLSVDENIITLSLILDLHEFCALAAFCVAFPVVCFFLEMNSTAFASASLALF